MASSWGNAWGGAFGASFGRVAQVLPPVINPPMGASGGWAFAYVQHPKSSHLRTPRSRHAREADLLLLHRL